MGLGDDLLRLARILVRPILAAIEGIIAPNFDIVLEKGIFIRIDHGSCIRQDGLNLGLLVAVQPWSTEEFKCSCVVPIDV